MSALAQMEEQIANFSMKDQLRLLAYIANNINRKPQRDGKKSYFGALKDKISGISPDFDAPMDDFAEYM